MTVDFSTRTRIVDVASGKTIPRISRVLGVARRRRNQIGRLQRPGCSCSAGDPNYFYATLATQRRTYLVKGDLDARTVAVIRENVECPSLSPDGTRIAFKKRVSVDGQTAWHPAVLNLATGAETWQLSTGQSVDDQINGWTTIA